jgi:hypothetical protein
MQLFSFFLKYNRTVELLRLFNGGQRNFGSVLTVYLLVISNIHNLVINRSIVVIVDIVDVSGINIIVTVIIRIVICWGWNFQFTNFLVQIVNALLK